MTKDNYESLVYNIIICNTIFYSSMSNVDFRHEHYFSAEKNVQNTENLHKLLRTMHSMRFGDLFCSGTFQFLPR
jgi:hypothetical protein